MNTVLIILGILIGLPGALAAIHLTVLSIASLFYREAPGHRADQLTFLVVIPAHNEEAVIEDTLRTVTAEARDADLILVVADRCTDSTGEIAQEWGALVLERGSDETPGRAAAVQSGIRWASDREWDAVVTIDADSRIEPGFFDATEAALATGAQVAQARSEHVRGESILAAISEAAFAMQGVTVPRGRETIGAAPRLRGSGMTMTRAIAEGRGFSTEGTSEDLFYSLDLILDGIHAKHVDSARLRSLSAPNISAGAGQRVRWETGRMAAAKVFVPRLLRKGTIASLESVIHLVTPPIAVAAFSLMVGALLTWSGGASGLALAFVGLFAALVVCVMIGLVQSGAPLRTWGAFFAAPPYILWKVWLQVLAVFKLKDASKPYRPTERT